jgi:hypothetical protein
MAASVIQRPSIIAELIQYFGAILVADFSTVPKLLVDNCSKIGKSVLISARRRQ